MAGQFISSEVELWKSFFGRIKQESNKRWRSHLTSNSHWCSWAFVKFVPVLLKFSCDSQQEFSLVWLADDLGTCIVSAFVMMMIVVRVEENSMRLQVYTNDGSDRNRIGRKLLSSKNRHNGSGLVEASLSLHLNIQDGGKYGVLQELAYNEVFDCL